MRTVNYRETLVTYLRADSLADAAQSLKITSSTLTARVKVMRKAGVRIPRKARPTGTGLGQLEVAQLNSIIIKYSKNL